MSRVALVLGRSTGGIGSHVAALGERLAGLGDEVRVVAPRSTHESFELPGPLAWWPTSVPEAVRTAEVRRLLRTADAVHAHGHQAGVLATVLAGGRGGRARLAISLHNELRGDPTSPRHQLGVRAVRRAVRRADVVTGASTDLVDLARDLGAREAHLDEVPSPRVPDLLGTDREGWRGRHRETLLRSHGLPTDRPVVLTVARIAPQKRLEDVVAAARELGPQASFVVVGSGDDGLRRRLEATAPPFVHLVGRSDDVAGWLLAADVFLLTSEWEARALVVQEAMAAGLPVLATRTGGLPDLVADAGLLVDVGDVTALEDALGHLLHDGPRRQAMAWRGRERARTWPTVEDRARDWHAWYAGADLVP